jgi:hypothetical protein
MKKALSIALITLFFSCSNSESEKREGFEVKIDTVYVDAGDELIFHQYGLSHSDLSNDQKRLFNFTPKDELEVIDLDSLKLLHKVATEKEGPLGTGRPYAIEVDQTGRLVMYGFNEVRIFSPGLDSMKRYPLIGEALSGLDPELLAYFNPQLTDGTFLYAVYENYEQVPLGLAIVLLDEMRVKKIPIELAARVEPFTYSLFVQGRLGNRFYDPIHMELVDNRLILSTAYANEAFTLDLETDSATLKSFHSELTQDKKPIPAKTATETINEMEDLRRDGEKSVKFGAFHFDKTHRRFWRFSRDIDREIGDSLVFKNVLTVFDEDLNQLAETVVPIDPFSKKFFKDGKLWSYVNVEDELGFAVLTLDF